MVSGDIYEQAVLLSVKVEDQDAFERDFFQLKPYYTDAGYVDSILSVEFQLMQRKFC